MLTNQGAHIAAPAPPRTPSPDLRRVSDAVLPDFSESAWDFLFPGASPTSRRQLATEHNKVMQDKAQADHTAWMAQQARRKARKEKEDEANELVEEVRQSTLCEKMAGKAFKTEFPRPMFGVGIPDKRPQSVPIAILEKVAKNIVPFWHFHPTAQEKYRRAVSDTSSGSQTLVPVQVVGADGTTSVGYQTQAESSVAKVKANEALTLQEWFDLRMGLITALGTIGIGSEVTDLWNQFFAHIECDERRFQTDGPAFLARYICDHICAYYEALAQGYPLDISIINNVQMAQCERDVQNSWFQAYVVISFSITNRR